MKSSVGSFVFLKKTYLAFNVMKQLQMYILIITIISEHSRGYYYRSNNDHYKVALRPHIQGAIKMINVEL